MNQILVYRKNENDEDEVHEFFYNWSADARTINGKTLVVFKNRISDPNTVYEFTNVEFVEINGRIVNLNR